MHRACAGLSQMHPSADRRSRHTPLSLAQKLSPVDSSHKGKIGFLQGRSLTGYTNHTSGQDPCIAVKPTEKDAMLFFEGFVCLLFYSALCGMFFFTDLLHIYLILGDFLFVWMCFINHMCFLCFFLVPLTSLTPQPLCIFSYSGLVVFILSYYCFERERVCVLVGGEVWGGSGRSWKRGNQ